MIIAWIISLIAIITTLVINLEHSAALQIRLLAIEQEAHAAFAAAENKLDQCEAQLSNAVPLVVPTAHHASAACDITVVDANARGELIQVREHGSALSKHPIASKHNHPKQTQLESMVYRDKQDHSIKRLNWRVLWSETRSIRPQLP
jgi:Tfp pilus assembly protein PilX